MTKTDRINDTLHAILQPWFLGPSAKPYVNMIEEKLKSSDRSEIESHLSLGGYAIHSETNKRLRHAQRACLLANFVMRPLSLNQAKALKGIYRNQSMELLRRSFTKPFPCFWDRGNREKWAPVYFTRPGDPAIQRLYEPTNWSGREVPKYRFLIHSMTEGREGTLITEPESTLQGWDAISCSVISNEKPNAYDRFGLILKASQYNILTTSGADQWFDNYVGLTKSTKNPLPQGVDPSSAQAKGMFSDHVREFSASIGGLISPERVLELTGRWDTREHMSSAGKASRHNEVVVTGKGNVAIGDGYSKPIEVDGIFVLINPDGNYYSKTQGKFQKELIRGALKPETIKKIEALSRTKRLRILYLPVP